MRHFSKAANFGLSFPPELGPILLANEGQSGAVALGRQGMKEAAN
jgi:hypothetical protein